MYVKKGQLTFPSLSWICNVEGKIYHCISQNKQKPNDCFRDALEVYKNQTALIICLSSVPPDLWTAPSLLKNMQPYNVQQSAGWYQKLKLTVSWQRWQCAFFRPLEWLWNSSWAADKKQMINGHKMISWCQALHTRKTKMLGLYVNVHMIQHNLVVLRYWPRVIHTMVTSLKQVLSGRYFKWKWGLAM